MAAALEERSTHEVLDRNEAIEALKAEVEVLGPRRPASGGGWWLVYRPH
jgi:hypothetical protein